MIRDGQRSKVYEAEDAYFKKSLPPEYATMDEVGEYVQVVINSQYWKKCGGWKRVKTGTGKGRRSACYKPYSKQVCFPLWSRSRWIVIHEMSHCLTDKTSKGAPWHGTHFVGHYLNLVEELLGVDVAESLAESFVSQGVRWYGWRT